MLFQRRQDPTFVTPRMQRYMTRFPNPVGIGKSNPCTPAITQRMFTQLLQQSTTSTNSSAKNQLNMVGSEIGCMCVQKFDITCSGVHEQQIWCASLLLFLPIPFAVLSQKPAYIIFN